MELTNNNFSIVKCSYCNQILSVEKFDSHECDLSIRETKRIEVSNFLDVSYKNKKLMSGWGIDGVLYTFEVVPRKPIPMIMPLNRRNVTTLDQKKPTDDFSHEPKTDGDFTEPWITKFISKLCSMCLCS